MHILTATADELTLSEVKTLLKMYQTAIEYYTGISGPESEVSSKDVLMRMQSLLSREDVCNLLALESEKLKE